MVDKCPLPFCSTSHRRSVAHWVAMALAAAYWLAESLLDWLGRPDVHDAATALVPVDPHELWMRGITVAMLVAGGFFARRLVNRSRANERALEDVLESTTDAFMTVDGEWRLTYVNGRAEDLYDLDRDEALGRDFWEVLPEARERFYPALSEALRTGTQRVCAQYCPAIDRYVEVRALPHAGGMSMYFRDVTERHQNERELRHKNEHLQAVLDAAGDSIVVIDAQGIVLTFNRSAEQVFGYAEAEVAGRNVSMLMDGHDAKHHDEYIHHYLTTGESTILHKGPREVQARRRDGSPFEAELAVGEMRVDDAVFFVGVLRDVTERKKADAALRRSEASLARAQTIGKMGSWEWEVASGQLCWSDQIYRMFGLDPATFTPTYEAFLERVHPSDRGTVIAAIEAAMQGARTYSVEHRVVLADGSERVLHEQGEVTFGEEGQPLSMMGTSQDITERVQAQEAIEFMANFDPLTGLPNRSLLQYRLQQGLSQAKRERSQVCLAIVGVDRFKNINDTLGHRVGDEVLKAVGERLASSVREGDTVAHLGSDEFAAVLFGIEDADEAAQLALSAQARLREPLTVADHEVFVTASVGLSIFPHDGADAEQLFSNADAALHRAKQEGPDSYQFFTADMTAESQARMRMEQDLRRALDREEFELHYQPQLDLSNGRVVGIEALLRWRHPQFGLVSPGNFIPILEETGLILPVGQWVMAAACEQNRRWQDQGLPPLRVAVNLSAIQFRDDSLVDQVAAVLERTGLEASYLELEITEGLLVENVEDTIELLERLHHMGVQLSIDDFGTGYSSMSYLQRFPVHTLKLDRSFVDNVTRDEGSASIAKAVIALAHSLRLNVIAEGVETVEQEGFLRVHECDEVQGFYYSKPLPPATLAEWLAGHTEGTQARVGDAG